MSKRKKKWWNGGFNKLFSNTMKKHKENGVVFEEEDDTYNDSDEFEGLISSPFSNWGLEQKLTTTTYATPQERTAANQASFDFASKQGEWAGYHSFKKSTLSYRYVTQMANLLSAKHRIKMKVGSDWHLDLLNRVLTYNPTSLVYGTKAQLLSTLMHEIGKVRYCDHHSVLNSKYIAVYGGPALNVFGIFEDIRSDFLMLKDYPGAAEVYNGAVEAVDKRINDFRAVANHIRTLLSRSLLELYKSIRSNSSDSQELGDNLLKAFGIRDEQIVVDKIQKIEDDSRMRGNFFDYCAEMYLVMYDSENFPPIKYGNIEQFVRETEDRIEDVKRLETSQDSLDLLDTQVFPRIENLLKDHTPGNEQIAEQFPDMDKGAAKSVTDKLKNMLDAMAGSSNKQDSPQMDQKGNPSSRHSGPSGNTLPQEWGTGDYTAIKDSVIDDVRQLINKLTFLKREQMAVKYETDQKRGKINSRKLYKAATGSNRIFKKMLPNLNTVQSFAFSLLVDVSSSMNERNRARIIHTTRAAVLISEVFKKMSIPFEIVTFGNTAKHLKRFDQTIDKGMEEKLGGMVNMATGGTNLDQGLKAIKIETREEKNKVCIVLTDGGVGNMQDFDNKFFIPMKQKGITSIGFGLECESEMRNLCMGNSRVLNSASDLPQEFSDLLKNLILKSSSKK